MLQVYTDLLNDSWLVYVLEEFSRISGAQFEIIVCKEKPTKRENILSYTKIANSNIQRKNDIIPNNNYEWISDNFFILSETNADFNENFLNYDIFWNAFVQLSRLEEWNAEQNGIFIHSYALRHPRQDKSTFDIPIVNYYFRDLKNVISEYFPELKFDHSKKAEIEWSHDLDYISKTIQLRLKQTTFNGFNTLKSFFQKDFSKNLNKTFSFLFSNPSYWCFDYWEELEKQHNITSVFYIYAKHKIQKQNGRKIKSWLIDPSYDVSNNQTLKTKLKSMIDDGFKIGLHGSFNSATDGSLLKTEKETLESALKIEILKTRQHWLNYTEQDTAKIHNKLFKEDSTIGWNERPGFRAGICSPYRPYNHKDRKPFDYIVIPQILMDSHIFDYKFDTESAINLVKNALNIPNSRFSISWHPRTCSSDYQWHNEYENLLKLKHD